MRPDRAHKDDMFWRETQSAFGAGPPGTAVQLCCNGGGISADTCPSAALHQSTGSQQILPVGLIPSHPKQNKHTLFLTLGISCQILCHRLGARTADISNPTPPTRLRSFIRNPPLNSSSGRRRRDKNDHHVTPDTVNNPPAFLPPAHKGSG